MADHPILFSAPMVRANNDGRKTQTRRLLTPENLRIWTGGLDHGGRYIKPDAAMFAAAMNNARDFRAIEHTLAWVTDPAPHQHSAVMAQWQGKLSIAVGDRLWVREAWRTISRAYDDLSHAQLGGEETILYDADANWCGNKSVGRLRSSTHMPRWASRTTCIVEAIKVERLQDISETDAAAEGWPSPEDRAKTGIAEIRDAYPIGWYAALWEHINGPGSWAANPWVVCYTYRVIRQNIDQLDNAA